LQTILGSSASLEELAYSQNWGGINEFYENLKQSPDLTINSNINLVHRRDHNKALNAFRH
jgi:hypothetical protein